MVWYGELDYKLFFIIKQIERLISSYIDLYFNLFL